MSRRRQGILHARKGAVLAEFAIAFMPICAMFLCVCQLARYSIDRLAVLHAAQVAVRACAVIKEPDPGSDTKLDGPESDIGRAAEIALAPFEGSTGTGELSHSEPTCDHTGEANGGTDTLTLKATFTCKIPLASKIVCSDGDKDITVHAQFPHQGAYYKL